MHYYTKKFALDAIIIIILNTALFLEISAIENIFSENSHKNTKTSSLICGHDCT